MNADKRRGRPTKAPVDGERVSLGLRVTAEVKRRLDEAAASSGRSQSQEAEMRLIGSLPQADSLLRAIVRHAIGSDPKYSPPLDGRIFALSPEMKALIKARLAAFVDSIPDAPPSTLSSEEEDELWELLQQHKLRSAKPKKGV